MKTLILTTLLMSGCGHLTYDEALNQHKQTTYSANEIAVANKKLAITLPLLKRCVAKAQTEGRALNAREKKIAAAMGVQRTEDVRIVVGQLYDFQWLRNGLMAHTCNNTVWIMGYAYDSDNSLAHELAHVAQWESWPGGSDDFTYQNHLIRTRTSYAPNPYEKEARRRALSWSFL